MTEFSVLTDSLKRIADTINARFSNESHLDFKVISLRNDIIKVTASTDFLHFQECEIEFSPVEYFNGPMHWRSNPAEGLMEVLPLSNELFSERGYGLAIAFNTDTSRKVIIASAFVKYNFEKLHY